MAQHLSINEVRNYDVNGQTFDLVALIEALNETPDGWVSPQSVNELQVGQIVHVWALGDRLRRGVVAKLGRTKVTVVFTTQGAVGGDQWGRGIRVSDTAVQLSQIKIPAAPVAEVAEAQIEETPAQPEEKALDASSELARTLVAADHEEALADPRQWATGSAVVRLLERVHERIRQNHPEVPQVVIVTGAGIEAFGGKWGHFRPKGWTTAGIPTHIHEMFMAGETLAKGSRQVLQTMLHESAHALAEHREEKDTSRQGRWHNKVFLKTAQELGLEYKSDKADKALGYSQVTLTAETLAEYKDLLEELDAEINLMVRLPGWLGGTTDQDGEDQGGENMGKKPSTGEPKTNTNNVKTTCACEEPNIIRMSRKVLDKRVVSCEDCQELFEDRS
jgi:hypothetical protein